MLCGPFSLIKLLRFLCLSLFSLHLYVNRDYIFNHVTQHPKGNEESHWTLYSVLAKKLRCTKCFYRRRASHLISQQTRRSCFLGTAKEAPMHLCLWLLHIVRVSWVEPTRWWDGHFGVSHWDLRKEGQQPVIGVLAGRGNSHSHIPQELETTPPSQTLFWKPVPKLTSMWELAIKS